MIIQILTSHFGDLYGALLWLHIAFLVISFYCMQVLQICSWKRQIQSYRDCRRVQYYTMTLQFLIRLHASFLQNFTLKISFCIIFSYNMQALQIAISSKCINKRFHRFLSIRWFSQYLTLWSSLSTPRMFFEYVWISTGVFLLLYMMVLHFTIDNSDSSLYNQLHKCLQIEDILQQAAKYTTNRDTESKIFYLENSVKVNLRGYTLQVHDLCPNLVFLGQALNSAITSFTFRQNMYLEFLGFCGIQNLNFDLPLNAIMLSSITMCCACRQCFQNLSTNTLINSIFPTFCFSGWLTESQS
eukprot:TRINITY_DN138112_c0_g1_i1.p1 TRINITY_DN138112_c0_g1~~TRINITY_DN138112_c0_g1_i1.p1  ORF type:complete len:299 (+),score=-43.75 TRINITY_DN138112_c0_g1_i1:41-937(+)